MLFHRSLAENIAYARPEASAPVVRAARLAHAHRFLLDPPDGYQTLVGGAASSCRAAAQRVAIRALSSPTNRCSSWTRRPLLVRLGAGDPGRPGRAHEGPHHDRDHAPPLEVRQVDRILVFEAGRIVEGHHDQLVTRQMLLSATP